jgi:hypothetical protein
MKNLYVRVWDEINQQMDYSPTLTPVVLTHPTSQNHNKQRGVLMLGTGHFAEHFSYKAMNQYPLMGMVYEGDIVEDHVGIGVVEWCEDNQAFKTVYEGSENTGYAKWWVNYNLKGEKESIRLIGNIYEHSLLEIIKAPERYL